MPVFSRNPKKFSTHKLLQWQLSYSSSLGESITICHSHRVEDRNDPRTPVSHTLWLPCIYQTGMRLGPQIIEFYNTLSASKCLYSSSLLKGFRVLLGTITSHSIFSHHGYTLFSVVGRVSPWDSFWSWNVYFQAWLYISSYATSVFFGWNQRHRNFHPFALFGPRQIREFFTGSDEHPLESRRSIKGAPEQSYMLLRHNYAHSDKKA